jgi:hypothetical protein
MVIRDLNYLTNVCVQIQRKSKQQIKMLMQVPSRIASIKTKQADSCLFVVSQYDSTAEYISSFHGISVGNEEA